MVPHFELCEGALLYDARQLFDAGEARADEVLRSIAEELPAAVTTCVEAAAAELEPARQAALMKVFLLQYSFTATTQQMIVNDLQQLMKIVDSCGPPPAYYHSIALL